MLDSMGIDFGATLAAFALTAALLWLLQPLARRLNLLDHPAGRKDHAVPTPVTGGIAIFLAVTVLFFWTGARSPAAYS
ncbi:UDP-GlcNAc:undecaprenyl-phosphate GlcNAc-1-phosphate transferase, partial [Thermomonas hydrothermalis]